MARKTEFDAHRLAEDDSSLDDYRTPFRRDYARVVHSPAFRRMQYKTQLFPGHESDFIRNRLTHSIEVSQIAKTIGLKLAKKYPQLDVNPDICETAGLLHDIGHPPFGHVGEDCLDELMVDAGGFESNAQTLRIIGKLEKKVDDGGSGTKGGKIDLENRKGLNLTYRTILSCIKYWKEIPLERKDRKGRPYKGYYSSEKSLIKDVAKKVLDRPPESNCKSIECSIMDIADDIAYSTYDIDDAFKSGFLTPLGMMNASPKLFDGINNKLSLEGGRDYCRSVVQFAYIDWWWENISKLSEIDFTPYHNYSETSSDEDYNEFKNVVEKVLSQVLYIGQASESLAQNAYVRNAFTSKLIGEAIESVDVLGTIDDEMSILTPVDFTSQMIKDRVNVFKEFTLQFLISSPEFESISRTERIVIRDIFEALTAPNGYKLMPRDHQLLYESTKEDDIFAKKRIICDYIAGMTDRYATEFHKRITAIDGVSIFRPYY